METIAVIPAYNEEAHIAAVVKGAQQFVQKVIVVDDGSHDSTRARAAAAGATVLRHVVNMGKGVALKTGFAAAAALGADVLVVLDGDGQHDVKDIPRFLTALQHADIVIGARQLNMAMPVVFKMGNFFLQKAFCILFNASISDTQSGYRAFRRGIYEQLTWQSHGYSVETEMLVDARKKGFTCVEIPIKTVYLNAVKGTTIIDGMLIFIDMLLWKMRG